MGCQFCRKDKNRNYLLSKHARFCLFCGDSLEAVATGQVRDRAVSSGSKVYMNAKVDAAGNRVCPECGEVVRRSDPRAVYCSLECQARFNGRRQRERKKGRL